MSCAKAFLLFYGFCSTFLSQKYHTDSLQFIVIATFLVNVTWISSWECVHFEIMLSVVVFDSHVFIEMQLVPFFFLQFFCSFYSANKFKVFFPQFILRFYFMILNIKNQFIAATDLIYTSLNEQIRNTFYAHKISFALIFDAFFR